MGPLSFKRRDVDDCKKEIMYILYNVSLIGVRVCVSVENEFIICGRRPIQGHPK